MEQNDLISILKRVQGCRRCTGLNHLTAERAEINLWNRWQGDPSARLVVIGQDFGNPDTIFGKRRSVTIRDIQENPPWLDPDNPPSAGSWNSTDYNLYRLFKEAFDIDLTKRHKLFFTNMVCCYRQTGSSGDAGMPDRWLAYCAYYHMGELLRAIQPDVLIVLGQRAFEALKYCPGAVTACRAAPMIEELHQGGAEGRNNRKLSLYDLMKCEYVLQFPETSKPIHVFPVYHPGARPKQNHPIDAQIEDWKKIRDKLDKLDRSILQELRVDK